MNKPEPPKPPLMGVGCNDKVLRSWEYAAAVLEEE